MNGGNTQRLDKADVAAALDTFLNTSCFPRIKSNYDNTIHDQETAQNKGEKELTRGLIEVFELNPAAQQPEPLQTLTDIVNHMADVNHPDNPLQKKENELKKSRAADDGEFKTQINMAETDSINYKKQIEDEITINLRGRQLPPSGLPRLSILKFLAVNLIHALAYPFSLVRRIFRGDIREDYRTQMEKLLRQVRKYKRL